MRINHRRRNINCRGGRCTKSNCKVFADSNHRPSTRRARDKHLLDRQRHARRPASPFRKRAGRSRLCRASLRPSYSTGDIAARREFITALAPAGRSRRRRNEAFTPSPDRPAPHPRGPARRRRRISSAALRAPGSSRSRYAATGSGYRGRAAANPSAAARW
jgi:hypothetical protein